MGFFDKLKQGLLKTRGKLLHEVRRIFTRSPKLTRESLEELEHALISSDFGVAMTASIVEAVRKAYETQGAAGMELFAVARAELERSLIGENLGLVHSPGLTIVSVVGVNGTGKTTTTAKLAAFLQSRGHRPMLAACDTFRAAAIDQLKIWGGRLDVPVVAGAYGADPSSVAHDAVQSALARDHDYLLLDTAGRLHTKSNLMQELQKLHRVSAKLRPGSPHETLLVLDATTGMNAINQAREFHKAVPLTGLVVTKLDGTSKGGVVAAIQKELSLPVKFIGVGEQVEDLQPFNAADFAAALFPEGEAATVS